MEFSILLEQLLTLGPVVTLLVSIIIYLAKKLTRTENHLKEIAKETRESEKENILVLDSISNALDKLSDKDIASKKLVIVELRSMRDLILSKLENK